MDIDEFLDKEIQGEKKEDTGEADSQASIEGPSASDATEESAEETVVSQATETDAIKHYIQLWNKVSEVKFKWDSKLYDDLNKEGDKVKGELDRSLSTVEGQKKAIKRLIGKAISELENRNYEAATKLYSEISNMRNNLPAYFLEEKKELNREVFLLYEKLHDKIDSRFINDFKESIVKVHNFIKDSFSSLAMRDMEKAKIFYEKALGIYKDLPNGFLSEKMKLGDDMLKLYKDLSIQAQIKDLQQHLSKEAISGDDKTGHLSEIIKKRNLERKKTENPGIHSKTLLPRLIARKFDRAKISLKKGLYSEAKRNIEAILKVDPENIEAKQMLSSIPAQN